VFFRGFGFFWVVLPVQLGWAIFVNFGKELLWGSLAVWGYDTWRFVKYSDELAPRCSSIDLFSDLGANSSEYFVNR